MSFDVTTGDIESRWRDLSDAESDIAFTRLADADRNLRLRRPGLEAFYTELADSPAKVDLLETIRQVLAEVVINFLKNPDLVSQQQIQSDGGVGIGYDTKTAGGVRLSDADLATIDAAVAAASGAVRPRTGSQKLATSFPYRTATSPYPLPTP